MTSEQKKISRMFNSLKPSLHCAKSVSLVACQPIFDLQSKICAYELLFRDTNAVQANITNSNSATSSVMLDGFNMMRPSLLPGQRFFINFTEEMLTANLPSILPPDVVGIEILETVSPTPELMESLRKMRKDGYLLILDDFTGQPNLIPFLPLVNMVKVDVLGMPEQQLKNIATALTGRVTMLAEKVEDIATEKLCRDLGFTLFQGFFYSKAEIVSGKKINPSQITKTRLINYSTQSSETSFKELVQAIKADIYLTFKLLRYVNSVYFGLPVKAKTVDHAISLMGTEKLRHWIMVISMADMNSAPLAREVVYISAQRAKFLETLAIKSVSPSSAAASISQQLFLAGLFSLLDIVLGISFAEIAQTIPMEPEIEDLLINKNGCLKEWFTLMEAYERGEWDAVLSIANHLNISPSYMSTAYSDAALWSSSFFGNSSEE